jgi:YggT family protein
MLTKFVYPYVLWVVTTIFLVFLAALLLRVIFNYADPNPFGKIGRFSYHLKKRTDRYVYPAARFLASYRVDTRLAPILTALIAGVITYFLVQVVENTFKVIDGLSTGIATGNTKMFIGFVLYGILSVLVFCIFVRFLSSWFVFKPNAFLSVITRVTDPILIPFRKLIPPIGMFDISAMIVLILIGLLQSLVMKMFVY